MERWRCFQMQACACQQAVVGAMPLVGFDLWRGPVLGDAPAGSFQARSSACLRCPAALDFRASAGRAGRRARAGWFPLALVRCSGF